MTAFSMLVTTIRRALARPGFAAVVVITFALGIGVTVAMFGIVEAILLRPLPYPDPDRLTRIWESEPAAGELEKSVSLGNFFDWKEDSEVFASMAAYVRWHYTVVGRDNPEQVWGGMATGDLFTVLGVQPVLGRGFEAEDQPGAEPVVVLGHDFWQTRFDGDPTVLDETLTVEGKTHRVVGVMPAGFDYPDGAQIWTPLALARDSYPRSLHFLRVVARLRPGISLHEAQDRMRTLAAALAEEYSDTNEGLSAEVVPLHRQIVDDVRPALLVLLAAVALVHLIACVNIAHLLMARAVSRRTEVAVRAALGAGRGRLIRGLLAETLALSLLGGVLGVGLAALALRGVVQYAAYDIPRLEGVGIDLSVTLLAFLLAVGSGLVVGWVPALQATRADFGRHLQGVARSGGASSRSPLRRSLVVAEVALALVLVLGAGLLIRSFVNLVRVDPGFRVEEVVTGTLGLPWEKYAEPHQTAEFFSRLLVGVRALPGVESAGAAWLLPISGRSSSTDFDIEGRAQDATVEAPVARVQPVTPGYFDTLGVALLRGRRLTAADDLEAPPVVLVNEALARRFWPGEEALGERISFGLDFGPAGQLEEASREIVGIVADFRNQGLTEETAPEIYFPHRQSAWRLMTVVVHTSGDLDVAGNLRQKVRSLDAGLPVDVRPLDRLLRERVARPRFNMWGMSLFAAVALFLAMVGIYGVVAYSVSAQTHEIGLRVALGAEPGSVLRSVVVRNFVPVLLGLLLGIALSILLSRWMGSLLIGVGPRDLGTFVLVPCALALAALTAIYVPARRATRVDPVIALREP